MSMETLGSLAQAMSDRYLRENFRRVFAGTTMSVASVMDGECIVSWQVLCPVIAVNQTSAFHVRTCIRAPSPCLM